MPAEKTPEKFVLAAGQVFKIEESSTCAVILNIERLEDSTMIFTAVPLVERVYEFADAAVITVKVPPQIRIDPECWPISGDVEALETKPVSLSPEETEKAAKAKAAQP